MNNKLSFPDEIAFGRKEYSWRRDWQVNGWLIFATIISALADIMFPHIVSKWPAHWQAIVVLVQFLAISLWARSLVRWIRGMDELQRRITVSAVLFAVSATFFLIMLWHRLNAAGLFQALFGPGHWNIGTVCHAYLLLTIFYFSSHTFFTRRYQ